MCPLKLKAAYLTGRKTYRQRSWSSTLFYWKLNLNLKIIQISGEN